MRIADLAVCTGADLEVGWLPVLLQAAGNNKVQPGKPGFIAAAELVDRLEVPTRMDRGEGDVHPQGNPHIHLDPRNIARVAAVVTQRLQQIDSANATYFEARGKDFQSRWQQAIAGWEKRAAPLRGKKAVCHHKSATYLLHWLGMTEAMNVEPKPGIPPSTGYLAELVARLKAEPADVIVRSIYNDRKPTEWLAERTGIALVVLPYTVGGTAEAGNLFTLFDESIARLEKAGK
jgi:zinc/manganese transport system substrate-binding protein